MGSCCEGWECQGTGSVSGSVRGAGHGCPWTGISRNRSAQPLREMGSWPSPQLHPALGPWAVPRESCRDGILPCSCPIVRAELIQPQPYRPCDNDLHPLGHQEYFHHFPTWGGTGSVPAAAGGFLSNKHKHPATDCSCGPATLTWPNLDLGKATPAFRQLPALICNTPDVSKVLN